MKRFLFATWDGAGNLVSTLGIAQRLVDRGHDVRLLGHESIGRRYRDGGWRLVPFRHTAEFDPCRPIDVDQEMAILASRLFLNSSLAQDLSEELAREPADVVVADCMLMGALSAGQASGIPTVALFHTPMAPFRAGPMVEMMAPAMASVNAMRSQLGLAAVAGLADVHDAAT